MCDVARYLRWSSLCFVLGCPDAPDATTTGGGESTGSTGSPPADDDDTADAPEDTTTPADLGDTSTSGTGTDDTGGAQGTICDRYIRCAETLADVPLSPIVGAYGPEGACWMMFDAAVCMHDCRAALLAVSAAHPEVTACLECEVDDECAYLGPGLGCNSGSCTGGGPGDPCDSDSDCGGLENGRCSNTGICVELCSDINHPCVGEELWCDVEQGQCLPGPPLEFCNQFAEDCDGCFANGCVFATFGPGGHRTCADIPPDALPDYVCIPPL